MNNPNEKTKREGMYSIPMLYIHFPFCVRKCQYCDFLSFPLAREDIEEKVDRDAQEGRDGQVGQEGKAGRERISSYLEALENEILAYKEEQLLPVSSVFIGGGTPSLILPKDFERLFETIRSVFDLSMAEEITIESNPGTITKEKAKAWKKAGVNRVSMGVQSMDDQLLKLLGRIHRKKEVLESYEILREAGFDNINLDLMTALPKQSMEAWQQTLQEVVELQPEHLSCYSLILEEGTPFYEKMDLLDLPEDEEERDMVHFGIQFLERHGYHQYEISNFAREGKECRHNIGYWRRRPYYGLGLGAAALSSKDVRSRNTDDLSLYLRESSHLEMIRAEEEELSREDCMEEFMFLGMRCTAGVSEAEFKQHFGVSLSSVYGEVLNKHLRDGLVECEQEQWRLTERGLDLSNRVFADFLL